MKLIDRILDGIILVLTFVAVGAAWYFSANIYYYI